ncbi:MAG: hypothetical protein K9K76_06515 [Halanaerobiales bacterium]|nr:hypothetical protein [Halanaerobiales bacterium]
MTLTLGLFLLIITIFLINDSNNSHSNKKYDNKALIIDTETTGLTRTDEFIEITSILVEFDKQGNLTIIDKYTGLREPNVDIDPKAQEVHNIDHQMLKNKQIDHQKLNELFNQTDLLVAHNVSFDKKFVKKEINNLNNKVWLCSMNGIRWYQKGFNSKGLQYLLSAHDIDPEQAHRSESDVKALIELLNYKVTSNDTYFKQLLNNYNIKEQDIDF